MSPPAAALADADPQVTTPVLAVAGLTLRFGGLTAVDGVSLSVQAGEIVAVIGPNGAGKTSLFNAITGMYAPTAGSVLIDGVSPVAARRGRDVARWIACGALTAAVAAVAVNLDSLWADTVGQFYEYHQPFPWLKAFSAALADCWPADAQAWWWMWGPAACGMACGTGGAWAVWRRTRQGCERVARAGVARTFQNLRLFRGLSVRDNVLVGMDRHLRSGPWATMLRLPGARREAARARREADDLLAFVGLTREAERAAGTLAYGHQRRLEIARALAVAPRLLLLDEPAAGANPAEAAALMALIQRIRERGISVLLIEHHMRVVMGLSDRVVVLHQGRVLASGTPHQVRSDPRVIAAYLGGPEPARAEEPDADAKWADTESIADINAKPDAP
jgi:ABC-type branched-subunit amino acid transport system ATPase component